MEQSITVTSENSTSMFYTVDYQWAVCRDILEDYFDLEDKPLKLTFTLSTEPNEDSYPVQLTSKQLKIHLTDGTIAREKETGYAYDLLYKFNLKANHPYDSLIHVSVV